jgi:hypothetical protein
MPASQRPNSDVAFAAADAQSLGSEYASATIWTDTAGDAGYARD